MNKNRDFEAVDFPQEIAEKLYNMAEDMDYMDYEEEKEEIIGELTEALYHLKTVCENKYNKNYFRTLYRILERI